MMEKSKIDDWILFGLPLGIILPDYISNLRTIDVLSNYYLFDFPLPVKFNYAGLGLYREKNVLFRITFRENLLNHYQKVKNIVSKFL